MWDECNRWSLEWISNFIPHFNWCDYLSMLGSKLNHVSKSRPGADWGILVSNLGIYKIRKQYPSIELFLQFEFPSRKMKNNKCIIIFRETKITSKRNKNNIYILRPCDPYLHQSWRIFATVIYLCHLRLSNSMFVIRREAITKNNLIQFQFGL